MSSAIRDVMPLLSECIQRYTLLSSSGIVVKYLFDIKIISVEACGIFVYIDTVQTDS